MGYTIPTTEPTLIEAGDLVKWTKELADYPATTGNWLLSYYFRNDTDGDEFEVHSSAYLSGDTHFLQIPITGSFSAGTYYWESYVSHPGSLADLAAFDVDSVNQITHGTDFANWELDAIGSTASAAGILLKQGVALYEFAKYTVPRLRNKGRYWVKAVVDAVILDQTDSGLAWTLNTYTQDGGTGSDFTAIADDDDDFEEISSTIAYWPRGNGLNVGTFYGLVQAEGAPAGGHELFLRYAGAVANSFIRVQDFVLYPEQRYKIDSGVCKVSADIANTTTVDNRTIAKKILDAIEVVLQDRATRPEKQYTVQAAGRSFTYHSLEELTKARDYWAAKVLEEEEQKEIDAGRNAGNRVLTRFTDP